MKLCGKVIKFCYANVREVGGQMVVCRKDREQVSVLNSTATDIWEFLHEVGDVSEDITYDDIVDRLKSKFDVSDIPYNDLVSDIIECIELLTAAGLLEMEDV